jgi:type IV pilus assembly protein PilO
MNIQLGISVIPKRFRLVLIIGLNVALFVVAYLFLIDPQLARKNRMSTELTSLQQELRKVTTLKNDIERLRKEHAQIKERLQEVIRQMPEEKEVPNLLRQVSFVAGETNTKVKSFFPKEVQNRDFYAELPFEIKYTAPYHNIGYFFDGIRKMERIVHVANFSLESKEVGQKIVMEGSCLAKTYVLRKDAPKGKKEEKNVQRKKK